MCRVGIGDGTGCERVCLEACALRAGVVARARLTAAFLLEVLGFLRLDRLDERARWRVADARLRADDLADRWALFVARSLFTPSPFTPSPVRAALSGPFALKPTLREILAKRRLRTPFVFSKEPHPRVSGLTRAI